MDHNERNMIHNPIGSMYGIFTYIYHKNQPNVGIYTIHGSYGNEIKWIVFLKVTVLQLPDDVSVVPVQGVL